MTSKATTHVIRGTLNWAKVIGEPRMNTFTDEREWSVDVTPDENGLAEIKRLGVADKLKEPKANDTRREKYLSFRQKEFRTDRDGNRVKNDPIKIVDAQGNPWPENKLIGNLSVGDVKFRLPPKVAGRPRGLYIQAIRVLEHVPFEIEEFAPLGDDDEYFGSGRKADEGRAQEPDSASGDELEDDVPF